MRDFNHLLLIPDGMRRFSRKEKIEIDETQELAATKQVEFIKSLLLVPGIVDELTIYALAAYNLQRAPNEVESLIIWCDRIFEYLLQIRKEFDFEVTVVGREDMLKELTLHGWQELERLISINSGTSSKRLNLLFCYESLKSCPENIPAHKWHPFLNPIDMIFRFGQPENLTRGSAIFPMSEQAYWNSITTLFPDADVEETTKLILQRFGRIE